MFTRRHNAFTTYAILLITILHYSGSWGMELLYSCEGERFIFPWEFHWDNHYAGIALFYKPDLDAKNTPFAIKEPNSTPSPPSKPNTIQTDLLLGIDGLSTQDSGIYTYYKNKPEHALHQGKLSVLPASECLQEKRTLQDLKIIFDGDDQGDKATVSLQESGDIEVKVTIPKTEQLPTIKCRIIRSKSRSDETDTELTCYGSYLADTPCTMRWNASKDQTYVINATFTYPAIDEEFTRILYIKPSQSWSSASVIIGVVVLVVIIIIVLIAALLFYLIKRRRMSCRSRCCKSKSDTSEYSSDVEESLNQKETKAEEI